jgi:hypothetical protein
MTTGKTTAIGEYQPTASMNIALPSRQIAATITDEIMTPGQWMTALPSRLPTRTILICRSFARVAEKRMIWT